MNSPLNQIFKSLNSLQEELNEQNKINVKQKNLKKINQFLLERKGLLNEDITSGRVIVYHRTGKNGSPIEGIAADGYRVGSGDYYGVGVYTTYDLQSQLNPNMINYGDYIIESKVLSMNKFLIFDYDIAKNIYGNVNYTLDNQLRLILGEKEWNNFNKNYGNILNPLIEKLSTVEYSAEIAKDFYEKFKGVIIKYLRGIVFTGSNDGKVLVTYERKNIEPLRYTMDDGKTWKNIINKDVYKRIKEFKPEKSDLVYQNFINQLESNNFANLNFKSDYIINNFDDLKKYINSRNIYNVINKISEDKRDILIDMILEDDYFMNKLNIGDVGSLLNFSKDPDKIINKVLQNNNFKNNLEWDGLSLLLSYSSDPEKVINFFGEDGKMIIGDLSSSNIEELFIHAIEPEKIIIMLGARWKKYINNISMDEILALLQYSKKPVIFINSLGKKGKEFIDDIDLENIKYLIDTSNNPEEIKQIFQQYGKVPREKPETVMNEIFNSLTSLQEELTEQRKVTIKESNLMKVQNFIKKRNNNQ
jgi:hypothetical protein